MNIDTVCIIDDDPICVYGTKILLNHNNFISANILIYEDGAEALINLTSQLDKGQPMPDIILLDLNMPVMNGWEFLDKFHELTLANKPRVFIVSSHFNKTEIEKGKSYSLVRDFISKPLIAKNLNDIIAMSKIAV
ncbi:response regulator receiver domain-containing protein [Maribacter caenipelagi]|uniref:Response regulator receiver domain-containing protein n=1 Tax=Maribacter caenipelagi TaxID=1447781 RepID=A0A4R7D9H8_9FLAO|nr:response regulator [Maribacter caenipelagi]TDS16655.1 response regulator receiver domain-containing protein [Maribacter caenipelagi]|tara:strand:+ start:25 stop:429 length:405 start_codon:yes stop_codon:yes gene_type:complete